MVDGRDHFCLPALFFRALPCRLLCSRQDVVTAQVAHGLPPVLLSQGREAPVQRLADSVAGRFCYTVMAASAITFSFWSLLGEQPDGKHDAAATHSPFLRLHLPSCLSCRGTPAEQ
jgi:hypothetical protein